MWSRRGVRVTLLAERDKLVLKSLKHKRSALHIQHSLSMTMLSSDWCTLPNCLFSPYFITVTFSESPLAVLYQNSPTVYIGCNWECNITLYKSVSIVLTFHTTRRYMTTHIWFPFPHESLCSRTFWHHFSTQLGSMDQSEASDIIYLFW